jgi:hypothetical protein
VPPSRRLLPQAARMCLASLVGRQVADEAAFHLSTRKRSIQGFCVLHGESPYQADDGARFSRSARGQVPASYARFNQVNGLCPSNRPVGRHRKTPSRAEAIVKRATQGIGLSGRCKRRSISAASQFNCGLIEPPNLTCRHAPLDRR